MTKPRLIAFYLPQYHPIPENDAWWGKGFTEWTNVAKAKPLFKGHYQPHIPADLGFYDLRVAEIRQAQADLARENGIEGFCYWHYWFAGKQLLERPFNEVLASGKPDFPFCLAWANESWTGVWHGAPDRILIEQTYPGEEDHRAHFQSLLPAFKDKRYMSVDNKPIFVIYRPGSIPDIQNVLHLWNEFAKSVGLPGLFFIGVTSSVNVGNQFISYGFDAVNLIRNCWLKKENKNFFWKILFRIIDKQDFISLYTKLLNRPYHVYEYLDTYDEEYFFEDAEFHCIPTIIPGWDNTPRSGLYGVVAKNNTPEKFKSQALKAINRVRDYPDDHKIIFIKSWNEWAEGNYLEPDQQHGHGFINALSEALRES